MPKSLRLEFVTPERAIAHEDVDEVELPGEQGFFAVLPGHAPLLAALKTGPIWYRKGNDKHFAFISGGFTEVTADRVSVLAQVAERAEDIDIARAEASKRRAEERLSKPTLADFDAERARIAMLRALTRLQVARHSRTRG
ncbi:MAG: F0F1 ATP synthase subunit epsilon [Acidobacteria bacterium]|nr:MAG: F0F1 ATP synthase subunit epsilon [Acidobacteriota bacterium]